MVVWPEPEIVTIKDYHRLCQENEVFFWHFVVNNPDMITVLKPVTNILGQTFESPLNEIQEMFNIKIYESFIEDSVDFLLDLGYKSDQIFQKGCNCFGNKFIGFRKGVKMAGTAAEVKCYCTEGVVEIIYLTNPLLFQ